MIPLVTKSDFLQNILLYMYKHLTFKKIILFYHYYKLKIVNLKKRLSFISNIYNIIFIKILYIKIPLYI
jgi:hypothetical protein